ncbi:MAG: sigma-70 family RNA polymerase sigma factor [Candidatus Omnitrophica bacterium]|nr:sigma-70 family RNA polymerase sigma factor [Candidatus Omnitrophota bacterium]MBU1889858.1 sigma-70 family RNA polymerase sigma factor [Candidatus Omnitrophota bacterium]
MKTEQDMALVRRVKMGDRDAFGELVQKYKQQIYFVAYRMTNNHTDADDLSQEAFIKAYESICNFQEKSSFFTWLYRIIMNITINHLKKMGRRQIFTLDENISIEDISNPEKIAESRQLNEEITKAINSLPLKQKAVVELALLEGLPHREIAQILGCREKTVSWRLFQARNKLKEKLRFVV